jgi:transposase InsO family protein
MPWQEVLVVDQRREFVSLAMQAGANRRELCRRFGISPDVGYKWLRRALSGDGMLADRSRRPHRSPNHCDAAAEAKVVTVRRAHPAWGARKIGRYLKDDGSRPPARSTVHEILRRHGLIRSPQHEHPGPYQRFEKETPNQLWQMDFKGEMPLGQSGSCYPLTVIDDHSRYALCLGACANQQSQTVQAQLTTTFRRYGLPDAFFVDNGSPWGDASGARWTRLGVWLLKLGVDVWHARPYHPQSRGKNERFHRTLKAEVFNMRRFSDLAELQRAFDHWRTVYNLERPHEALGLSVPASRYRASSRTMPDRLPDVAYDSTEIVRSVSTTKAYVSFKGRMWKVPQAFCGERLAIRPLSADGQFGIFFGSRQVASIDLTGAKSVSDVPGQVSAMSPG